MLTTWLLVACVQTTWTKAEDTAGSSDSSPEGSGSGIQGVPSRGAPTSVGSGEGDTAATDTARADSSAPDTSIDDTAPPPTIWWSSLAVGDDGDAGALTNDGSLVCWGRDVEAVVRDCPDGPFLQVSFGIVHGCGLGLDGSVSCWGGFNEEQEAWDMGQIVAPAGEFASLDVGKLTSCALDGGGGIVCWGDAVMVEAVPTGGPYTQLSVGLVVACAIDAEAQLTCWSDQTWGSFGELDIPSDVDGWSRVAAGDVFVCGLDLEGHPHCWGAEGEWDPTYGAEKYASYTFVELAAETAGVCGITDGGEILCWGYTDPHDWSSGSFPLAPPEPPSSGWAQIGVGYEEACAISGDGLVLQCWPPHFSYLVPAPALPTE